MQTRRILELVLGAAALIAVVAVVMSLGTTSETEEADTVDATLTVPGNVLYRERIVFPENTIVRGDAPPHELILVSAEQ